MLRSVILLLAAAMVASAQVDSNSVTVTASRNLTSLPDQALFQVTVETPITATLEEVIAALQGSGITASNLTGVNTNSTLIAVRGSPTSQPSLVWRFSLIAPLSKTRDTVVSLNALQQSVMQKNSAWSVSSSFYSTQTSPQAQAACPMADLMADARARAQKLADAAGLSLGAVSAIAGSTDNGYNCSLTVKFTLLRYQ